VSDDLGCEDGCSEDPDDHPRTLVEAMRYGFVTLPRDIGRALLFGIAVSGLIAAFIKPAALESFLGGGVLPMLAALAIGVPLYVCATASTPIALSLIYAGLSPGAALVFLISGPATNTAALTTLWKVLGRRTTVIYLVTVVVGAVATGLVVDGIIATGLVPASALISSADAASAVHAHHDAAGFWWWMKQASAVVLLAVVIAALWPRRRTGDESIEPAAPDEHILEMQVSGMRCNGCVQSLSRALGEVDGVTTVDVRLDDGIARVSGRALASDRLEGVVASLGFEVTRCENIA
jgi:copper chaperone CopZ